MAIKRYLLIYSDCGDHTALMVSAEDAYDALVQVYSYMGEDYRLSSSEMRLLFNNSSIQRAYEIFHNFTGVSLVWFSEIQSIPLIDKLNNISEFSCKKVDRVACMDDRDYPSSHKHDIYINSDE